MAESLGGAKGAMVP